MSLFPKLSDASLVSLFVVALDGLADRAYALILEVVEGQIQGRQPAINAQGVSDCSDALYV